MGTSKKNQLLTREDKEDPNIKIARCYKIIYPRFTNNISTFDLNLEFLARNNFEKLAEEYEKCKESSGRVRETYLEIPGKHIDSLPYRSELHEMGVFLHGAIALLEAGAQEPSGVVEA